MDIPESLAHCYARTLRIKASSGKSGSAFVMQRQKCEWLVTAKHIVGTLSHDQVEVDDRNGQNLSGLGTRLPTSTKSNYDVAVFRFSSEVPDYFEAPLERVCCVER